MYKSNVLSWVLKYLRYWKQYVGETEKSSGVKLELEFVYYFVEYFNVGIIKFQNFWVIEIPWIIVS